MFRFYKLFPRFRNKTPQSIKPLMPLPPSTLMNEASRTHRDSETEMRLKSGSRTCTYLIPVPSLGAGNHCLGGETLYSGHCQGLCEYLRSDCLQLRQPSAPSVYFHSYHVEHHQDFISTININIKKRSLLFHSVSATPQLYLLGHKTDE